MSCIASWTRYTDESIATTGMGGVHGDLWTCSSVQFKALDHCNEMNSVLMRNVRFEGPRAEQLQSQRPRGALKKSMFPLTGILPAIGEHTSASYP